MTGAAHKKIYQTALAVLEAHALPHDRLIEEIISKLYGHIGDNSGDVGEFTEVRGRIGTVIKEMREDGVILNNDGYYSADTERHLALRIESCESEIVKLLAKAPKSKDELRTHLINYFKTNSTPSDDDDRRLFTYIGQTLRRLTDNKTIAVMDGKYALCEESRAKIDDLSAMLELKDTFLRKIHRGGGEFFEHYIVTLLKKYFTSLGNTVIEARVVGGANDGGVDGIIKQVTPIGFRETVMIQAKNRTDEATETSLRGFYGVLCASGATHGIYATTSDLHPSAKNFLSGIDNCIYINGDDIFNMACKCLYGIRKRHGVLTVDNKII